MQEEMTAKERGAKAKALFLEGYNCTQAVLGAFADKLGDDLPLLTRVGDSFGGGMGRLRLTCGAVSAMAMLAGYVLSSGKPKDLDNRTAVYAAVQEMAGAFEKANGSVICRDLLGAHAANTNPRPDERTPEYYASRPCPDKIAQCASIAARVLFKEM